MWLSSSVFQEGQLIPRRYTCQGIDISPPLSLGNIPPETQSLALIVEDPDVPLEVRKDGLWIHWVIFNVPPTCVEWEEGVFGIGVVGTHTGKKIGYMGPCPPDREHRYFFKLYALDSSLKLTEGVTREEVLKEMEGHILAKACLMGRYEQV